MDAHNPIKWNILNSLQIGFFRAIFSQMIALIVIVLHPSYKSHAF